MSKSDGVMNKTKVIVSVSGGVVNGVCTNDPNLEVYLADFDELEEVPSRDCSVSYPADSLKDFCVAVRPYVKCYAGLTKLIKRISE